MDLMQRFEGIHDTAVQQLRTVTDAESAERLARIMRDCEQARKQIQTLDELASRLEAELEGRYTSNDAKAAMSSLPATGLPPKARSGKSEGKSERNQLLLKMQELGRPLQPEGGRIYRTPKGNRIGIGFANEGKQGDKWWLGVPNERLDGVVLICKPQSGNTLCFVLPGEYFSVIRPILSTNRSDVIFNVSRNGSTYELAAAPQSGLKAINQYLDRFDLLQ